MACFMHWLALIPTGKSLTFQRFLLDTLTIIVYPDGYQCKKTAIQKMCKDNNLIRSSVDILVAYGMLCFMQCLVLIPADKILTFHYLDALTCHDDNQCKKILDSNLILSSVSILVIYGCLMQRLALIPTHKLLTFQNFY